VARRREQARARIISVAAARFASAGVDGARLDEIADAADVARGTLYSHFPTKEALLHAVLEPVLTHACFRVRACQKLGPQRGVDALLALYLELWAHFPNELRVSYQARTQPLGALAALHGQFLTGVLAVFGRAQKARRLRTQQAELSARALATLAVPLLELYAGHPRFEALFVESLRGLLLAQVAR
jgi:AcrR family transcriptional regulator